MYPIRFSGEIGEEGHPIYQARSPWSHLRGFVGLDANEEGQEPHFALGADLRSSVSAHGGRLANDVGYESEPSFNRAFKREFGVPPA